jgi:outer membrane lipoprotein-sorting protein
MLKRIHYLFFAISLSVFTVISQNKNDAEKLISEVLLNAKNNAIKTDFSLIYSDKSIPNSQTTIGEFTLKGTKFVLEMDEMKVWFDGKTQWSFNSKNNEVTITEPSEKEIAETNPMAILSGFKSKSSISFSKINSTRNYIIEMLPKVKGSEILKIEVQVNKANKNLFSIRLTNKNGSSSLLTLNNFQQGITLPDKFFTFNFSKYKGVSENDLR